MKEHLSVTVPAELIKQAKELAKAEDRTLSAMISVLLKRAILDMKKAA